MSDQNMLSLTTQQNALTLAVAGDLIAGVISDIAGNEISNQLDGETVTLDVTRILVNQELVKAFTA